MGKRSLHSQSQPPHDEATRRIRFGAIVRLYRRRLRISQEELAWRAGIHRTYLADIERGKRNLSLTSIGRVVDALGVSLAVFFHTMEEYFQSPIETPPPAPKPPPSVPVPPAGRSRAAGPRRKAPRKSE